MTPSSAHEPATGARDTGRVLVVDCDGIGVALVAWPGEQSARSELARGGRPRVLLVAVAEPPPLVDDPLEDWVRVPVDHTDVDVRARRLARITAARRSPANGVGRTARRESALVPADRSSP
jgi:hypothetical protein